MESNAENTKEVPLNNQMPKKINKSANCKHKRSKIRRLILISPEPCKHDTIQNSSNDENNSTLLQTLC